MMEYTKRERERERCIFGRNDNQKKYKCKIQITIRWKYKNGYKRSQSQKEEETRMDIWGMKAERLKEELQKITEVLPLGREGGRCLINVSWFERPSKRRKAMCLLRLSRFATTSRPITLKHRFCILCSRFESWIESPIKAGQAYSINDRTKTLYMSMHSSRDATIRRRRKIYRRCAHIFMM